MKELPRKLRKAPIVEAIFETRFSAKKEGAGDLLPGLLFAKVGSELPAIEQLPLANIPRPAREQDVNLKYRPSHQFSGATRRILVGDRVVLLSQGPPYEGWGNFRSRIVELMGILKETQLVQAIERYSLKVINLFPAASGKQLELLNAHFNIEGGPVSEKGFRFRTEMTVGHTLAIIEIATNAVLTFAGSEPRVGMLLSIDGIAVPKDADDFWAALEQKIDGLHEIVKCQFFGLITEAALNQFEPIWADTNELH